MNVSVRFQCLFSVMPAIKWKYILENDFQNLNNNMKITIVACLVWIELGGRMEICVS